MPMMQAAVARLNERFSRAQLGELELLDVELTAPFDELARALLGDDLPRGFDEFIATMPVGIQAAIGAVLRSAVDRSLAVTFAWAPGYDWELSLWDVADTADTAGGITVLVRSRYPGDRHPLDRRSGRLGH